MDRTLLALIVVAVVFGGSLGLACSHAQQTTSLPSPTVEPYSTPTDCARITQAHDAVDAAAAYFGEEAPLLFPSGQARDVRHLDRIFNQLIAAERIVEELSIDEGCPASSDY